MIESLTLLDQQVLLAINGLAGNSTLDFCMELISSKWIWLPFYAFLLYSLYVKYGTINTGWILLAAASLLVLTDQGSVQLFKEVFQRLRPCHEPELKELLYLASGKCGGKFGFISSHASNVFGLAIFIFLLLKNFSKWWYLILIWATLVSFSRIYLAVHYPADVIVGTLTGAILGLVLAIITKKSIANT